MNCRSYGMVTLQAEVLCAIPNASPFTFDLESVRPAELKMGLPNFNGGRRVASSA